jgi:hypothetical protein
MSDTRRNINALDARRTKATQEGESKEDANNEFQAAKQRLFSKTMTMDARTIAKILKDCETMNLEHEASRHRIQLETEFRLKTFFQPDRSVAPVDSDDVAPVAPIFHSYTKKMIANAKTYYAYKPGTDSEMGIMLHKQPVDGRDFYELAMSISGSARGYYTEFYYPMPPEQISQEARIQQVVAHYKTKLDELAVEYTAVLKKLQTDFTEAKKAAEFRYQQSMYVANMKTASSFQKNRDNDVQIAEDFLFRQSAEKSILNNAEIARIKSAEADELKCLSTQNARKPQLSQQEAIVAFQNNLLRDAKSMGVEFLFNYKAGSNEEVALYSLKHPQTPNDFYELAMKIKAGEDRFHGGYFDVYYNGQLAGPETLKWFMFNILDDAAKAGHLPARHELIEATIKGDPEARKHVTLKAYHGIQGLSIMLPRKFKTSEELRRLGSDLIIQCQKGNCVDDKPLVGPYYELANAKDAAALGKGLRAFSEELRKLEEADRARQAYADQSMVVAQNSSAMFSANFVTSEGMAVTYPKSDMGYLPLINGKRMQSPDPSILSTSSLSDSDASTGESSPSSCSSREEVSPVDKNLIDDIALLDVSGIRRQSIT